MLSGCGTNAKNEPTTITVAVDLHLADDIELLKKYTELKYPDINIELLILDYNENDMSKRDGQLASIRADIMAGKGPDAFILSTIVPSCQYSNDGTEIEFEKLFGDPEKVMRNQVFLSLDEYINNSEIFSVDDHISVIMDAGKLDGTQYILPLTYTYDLYLYDNYHFDDTIFENWDDVVNFETEGLANSLKLNAFSWIGSRFTSVADYENNALSFSEDKLKSEIDTITDMGNKAVHDLVRLDTFSSLSTEFLDEWVLYKDIATPIPVLNNENGITAYVNHYAAINANTEHPEAAYKFIELLFSPEIQGFKSLTYKDGDETRYLDYELRPDGNKYLFGEGVATGKVLYEEYPMLEDMNTKINSVRFYTPIDKLLHNLVYDTLATSDRNLLSEYYLEMQMEMAE